MISCVILLLSVQVSAGICQWSRGIQALQNSKLRFFLWFCCRDYVLFLLNQPNLLPKCCTEKSSLLQKELLLRKAYSGNSCKTNPIFLPSSPHFMWYLFSSKCFSFQFSLSPLHTEALNNCSAYEKGMHLVQNCIPTWQLLENSDFYQLYFRLKCWSAGETGCGSTLFDNKLCLWVEKMMSFQNGSQCSMPTCFNYPGVKNKKLCFVENISRTADVNN